MKHNFNESKASDCIYRLHNELGKNDFNAKRIKELNIKLEVYKNYMGFNHPVRFELNLYHSTI